MSDDQKKCSVAEFKPAIRTTLGSAIQTHLLTGIPVEIHPNTTLNEKLDILADVNLPGTAFPQLKYFCIGNRGTAPAPSNNTWVFDPVQHLATDGSPFGLIPLVMREVNNDLTDEERARYALRRIEPHNGTNWVCYYLKRLDLSKNRVTQTIVHTQDGQSTARPMSYDRHNLNPEPQLIPKSGLQIVKSEYVDVSTRIEIRFDAKDAEELRNVGNIRFGDPRAAMVSELGLVTGVDKAIDITTGGSQSFRFNEAIATQVAYLINCLNSPVYHNEGFTITTNIGAAEPLLKMENVSS